MSLLCLNDNQFLKLFYDCKMELRSRIYRDIQEKLNPNWIDESLEGQVIMKRLKEEQGKTKTKLSYLSDLKFRVLLFDVFEQVEQRFPFTSLATKRSSCGLDKCTSVEEIALSGDESSQISSGPRQEMSQDLLSALFLLSRYSKRISATGLGLGLLKPPSSLLDPIEESELEIEPTVTLYNPSKEKIEKSIDQVVNGITEGDGDDTDLNLLESPTKEIDTEKVLKKVEICKNTLGLLFKCYQPPVCLDQGLAIKPMKTAISSLQDLSTNLSHFMKFLQKRDQENECDNVFRFLNCLLELIGSCVGVIMSKFHPSRTPSNGIQVIQNEILKIRYLLQSLETALSSSIT